MQYGICPLSIVPVRAEPSDTSEMVSQILYGELLKVLTPQKKWSKIRQVLDGYEGWIDTKQYLRITETQYNELQDSVAHFSLSPCETITTNQGALYIVPGSQVSNASFLEHNYTDALPPNRQPKSSLIDMAMHFLNSPYLWGGKTHFGIDCSGFTQIVYRCCGHRIDRDASQQVQHGEMLSFIEESEPGDLAFFDNSEGNIIHVGILLEGNRIIHAHGKVRIDRLDHTGIFNPELGQYSHQLRVIKKII